jgi:hypothetical protein
VGFLAYDVVVLAARPAEREREQRAVAVAGHEPLPVERQVPGHRRLRRGVDGVATAQELVQTEREHREAGRRVDDVVAGHELLADHLAAAVLLHTGQGFELGGAGLGSVDRRRDRPDDTVVDAAETERRLDPDRQRVG